jgi:hypothetical protein
VEEIGKRILRNRPYKWNDNRHKSIIFQLVSVVNKNNTVLVNQMYLMDAHSTSLNKTIKGKLSMNETKPPIGLEPIRRVVQNSVNLLVKCTQKYVRNIFITY